VIKCWVHKVHTDYTVHLSISLFDILIFDSFFNLGFGVLHKGTTQPHKTQSSETWKLKAQHKYTIVHNAHFKFSVFHIITFHICSYPDIKTTTSLPLDHFSSFFFFFFKKKKLCKTVKRTQALRYNKLRE